VFGGVVALTSAAHRGLVWLESGVRLAGHRDEEFEDEQGEREVAEHRDKGQEQAQYNHHDVDAQRGCGPPYFI